MDDEVGGVAPISDEQIEKLELSFSYSDDDYESLVNAFRNTWPSIICRLRSQAAEIAELRQKLAEEEADEAGERELAACEQNVLVVRRQRDEAQAELAEAKREAIADHERNVNLGIEIEALRTDLERASEKIEKQNAALLRVYTLEDENNALSADLERVREEKVAESRRLDWLDAQLGGFDEDGFEIRFHCSTNPDWPLRQVVDAKMDEEQADREMDPS